MKVSDLPADPRLIEAAQKSLLMSLLKIQQRIACAIPFGFSCTVGISATRGPCVLNSEFPAFTWTAKIVDAGVEVIEAIAETPERLASEVYRKVSEYTENKLCGQ